LDKISNKEFIPVDDIFFEKKVECLYCLRVFKTKRIKTGKVKIKKMDKDFCTYYEGHNPLFYEVNLCPYCKFAFTDGFYPSIPNARKEYLKNNYIEKVVHLSVTEYREITDALKYFKLALLCATLIGEKKFTLANLCMRIAWLNRYIGDVEEDERFLRYALERYNTILQSENLDQIPMEEEKMILLVAELHGRLGEYEQARQCFSFFFSNPLIDKKWRNIAKRRWEEYRLEQQINSND
jgi:uncharacterized protein